MCDFSFYVSARLMALQVIGGQIDILLPEYPDEGKLKITGAKKLTLSDVKVEQKFSGVMVDVMGRVRDYAFILYFTHPGRAFPDALSEPKDRRCGIVSISLDGLPNLFGIVGVKQSYKDRLSDFIVNDIASKKWRYHPRHARYTKHNADQVKDGNTTVQTPIEKHGAQRLANLECVFCKVQWQDLYPSPISCPKCHDHLGCRLICYVDNME